MTIKSKRGPNVTPYEHNLVVKFAKQCLREICKKQYELEYLCKPWGHRVKPVVYAEALNRLQVQTKYRNQSSYGSDTHICIDMGEYRLGATSFLEYRSFNDDPVIGDIKDCGDREILLKCLVAHEMSHHIQMRYGPHTRYLKNNFRKSHGDGFKTIYRELRRTLINPHVNKLEAA